MAYRVTASSHSSYDCPTPFSSLHGMFWFQADHALLSTEAWLYFSGQAPSMKEFVRCPGCPFFLFACFFHWPYEDGEDLLNQLYSNISSISAEFGDSKD